MMSRLALALAALVALVPACKAGKGDACRCASDCRSGLVCSAEGRAPRAIDQCPAPSDPEAAKDNLCCYPQEAVGACVEAADAADTVADELPDPMIYDDLPSKRDLGSGGSMSDSATDSTTDPTTTSTSTSTSTGSTTDPTTGTTATTGATDPTTGTTAATTGTTDPTTGTTAATTGTTDPTTSTGTTDPTTGSTT